MWIEGDVPPHDGAALLGHLPRKSVVDTDEPIPNELLYLPVARRTRAQTIIVSHEVSLYLNCSPTTPKAEAAGLLRFTAKNSSAAASNGGKILSRHPVHNNRGGWCPSMWIAF